VSIFKLQDEPFKLHSGGESRYKIDLDGLGGGDWECLAYMLAERLPPFRSVDGIPRGGLALATMLERHTAPRATLSLIVDDVCSTGGSLNERRRATAFPSLGAVVFARGPVPDWVLPLFRLNDMKRHGRKILCRLPWFLGNIDVSRDPDACWTWRRRRNSNGYGVLRLGRKSILAHRYFYSLTNGTIPDGLEIRHTCDNPPCCNPKHLLVGTHTENVRDSVDRKRHHFVRRTHCKHGHPLVEENVRITISNNGRPYRRCLTCGRENQRRYREEDCQR
jgi:hypothetical protein